MRPGVVNQNAPHRLRGDSEKMRAALPADRALVDKLEEGFVYKRGGLQRVVAPLAPQIA